MTLINKASKANIVKPVLNNKMFHHHYVQCTLCKIFRILLLIKFVQRYITYKNTRFMALNHRISNQKNILLKTVNVQITIIKQIVNKIRYIRPSTCKWVYKY